MYFKHIFHIALLGYWRFSHVSFVFILSTLYSRKAIKEQSMYNKANTCIPLNVDLVVEATKTHQYLLN